MNFALFLVSRKCFNISHSLQTGVIRLLPLSVVRGSAIELGLLSPLVVSCDYRCIKKTILVNDIADFFVSKIDIIRSNIDALSLSCLKDTVPHEFEIGLQKGLSSFKPLTEAAICKLIQSSAKKSCALDPLPTPLVVSCLDVLLPVITTIVNSSLLHGHFPSNRKEAIVTPILKKPSLTSEFTNLRPISNLQFISKLTERAVFDQLKTHLLDHALYPLLQSAYRKSHSTETALIKVQNDILMNMDLQQVTLLVLLDLSAVFDTIDHQVLLNRLRLSSVWIRGNALKWKASYLSDRTQRVSFENSLSHSRYLSCGVPQGSCLGPLLFPMYASKLFDIIKGHLPYTHAYADDTQLYLSYIIAVDAMERCVSAIRCWMIKDKLKVNDT